MGKAEAFTAHFDRLRIDEGCRAGDEIEIGHRFELRKRCLGPLRQDLIFLLDDRFPVYMRLAGQLHMKTGRLFEHRISVDGIFEDFGGDTPLEEALTTRFAPLVDKQYAFAKLCGSRRRRRPSGTGTDNNQIILFHSNSFLILRKA